MTNSYKFSSLHLLKKKNHNTEITTTTTKIPKNDEFHTQHTHTHTYIAKEWTIINIIICGVNHWNELHTHSNSKFHNCIFVFCRFLFGFERLASVLPFMMQNRIQYTAVAVIVGGGGGCSCFSFNFEMTQSKTKKEKDIHFWACLFISHPFHTQTY